MSISLSRIFGFRARRNETFWAYTFLIPSMLGLLVFWLITIVAAFGISFTDWSLLSDPEYIGTANYERLIEDKFFWKALKNTLWYVAGVMPGIVISLSLAVFLNRQIRFKSAYRTLYYLPTITMWVSIAQVWTWLYSPQFGLINWLVGKLGISSISWLNDPKWALPAVIITSIWKGVGYNMVIFLAGLQGIPSVYYEAAQIDGANSWQKFRRITLPLLSPTTYFVTVMTFIGSFGVFSQIFIMTEGGPGTATITVSYYIYTNAFLYFDAGYANTVAVAFFAIVFIFTVVQHGLQKRWVHY